MYRHIHSYYSYGQKFVTYSSAQLRLDRMGNPSQFSNCSKVNLADINLVFGVTGAVCCFISCLIVGLIICCKAYRTVLQRLFLYLMAAIVLRELFIAAALEHHWKYPAQDKVCMWIGFLWNWTGILVFVFTVGIKIYLFFLIKYYVAKGNTVPRFLQSKYRRVVLESLYLVLPTLVTLGYACIPFITGNYGLAGAWCWVWALDKNRVADEDCALNLSGMLDQLFNGYIFYISGSVIGLVLLIAVAIVYCRLPITNKENRLLLKKTFCVIITFLVNIVIMTFAFFTRVTAAVNKMYVYRAIWFSFAVTFPSSLLLFPIAYLICFSLGRRAEMCESFCRCFARNPRVQQDSVRARTVQESARVSAPSQTYCSSVAYTDEFTHISETAPMLPEHSTDLEYGSIGFQRTELDLSLKDVTP